MDTPCSYCGQPMAERTRTRARFCSAVCKDKARTKARRDAVIAGRPERHCAACGITLDPAKRADALCCSPVCTWRYQNRINAAARKAERRSHREPCPQCGGDLSADLRAGSIYCSFKCKHNAHSARWREQAPGYMRRYLYGITPEQFAELLESQGGRCAICRTDTPGGKGGWHVDHDHATKAIRGLLCHACNVALGNFNDDPARLHAAVAYLETPLP